MFDDWKRYRKLKRELREIDQAYSPQFKAIEDQMDFIPLRAEYDAVTGEIYRELNVYNLRRLRKRTDKFGVELPPFTSETDWDKHSWSGHLTLTQAAEAKVNREISKARFAYWKQWAELLVPILSLLVAIIALLAKSGGSPCPPCPPVTH